MSELEYKPIPEVRSENKANINELREKRREIDAQASQQREANKQSLDFAKSTGAPSMAVNALKKAGRSKVKEITKDKPNIIDFGRQIGQNIENIRDQKDQNMVVESAYAQGVDPNNMANNPSAPSTGMADQYTKGIIEAIKANVEEKDRKGVTEFVAAIPKPAYSTTPNIIPDAEKRKARAQRLAAWGDAISGFGMGLQGKEKDYSRSTSAQMQGKRDALFKDYRDVTDKNKEKDFAWKYGIYKDALDWVVKQQARKDINEAEKAKLAAMGEELALKAEEIRGNLGLKDRALKLEEQKQEEVLNEDVTYLNASGQTVTRKIPFSEQRDITSRAKIDPKFREYVKSAMNVKYQTIYNPQTGQPESVPMTEFGERLTDRDLMQAYLRFYTEGSPLKKNINTPTTPTNWWDMPTEQTQPSQNNQQQQNSIDDFFN